MAVRLRLKRVGRRNRPFYRICAFDSRTRRDGQPIEELGSYDPRAKTFVEKVILERERALHWLNVGALPSETVGSILNRAGVVKGKELPDEPKLDPPPNKQRAESEPTAPSEPVQAGAPAEAGESADAGAAGAGSDESSNAGAASEGGKA